MSTTLSFFLTDKSCLRAIIVISTVDARSGGNEKSSHCDTGMMCEDIYQVGLFACPRVHKLPVVM